MSQSFGDTAFSPKGVIWVLSIFERIRLSRYCAAIRERNSCLYRICKKNIFCSKYSLYHIFTTKYVLFAYAIQTRVTFTYRGTVSISKAVSVQKLIKPISLPWEKKPYHQMIGSHTHVTHIIPREKKPYHQMIG